MDRIMNERIDDLQRGGCRIIQCPELFCFGMDAVLLSAWAAAGRGDRVLDLCSGNGIVPILMDARLPEEIRREGSVQFTGIEINSICVDLARRSAAMNAQTERIHFLEGDVRDVCRPSAGAGFGSRPHACTSESCLPEREGAASASGAGSADWPDMPAPESFDCVTVNPHTAMSLHRLSKTVI